MASGVRYSGENNGFAKLLIPQLLTLSTQIIQSVARSIMLWANNLASGNPSPGQVLTVGDTGTRVASWENNAAVGGSWNVLALQAGWSTYPGYGPAEYRIIGDIVQFRGLIQKTGGTTLIAYLAPAPINNTVFASIGDTVLRRLNCTSGNPGKMTSNATGWVSLSGIWYSTL